MVFIQLDQTQNQPNLTYLLIAFLPLEQITIKLNLLTCWWVFMKTGLNYNQINLTETYII